MKRALADHGYGQRPIRDNGNRPGVLNERRDLCVSRIAEWEESGARIHAGHETGKENRMVSDEGHDQSAAADADFR